MNCEMHKRMSCMIGKMSHDYSHSSSWLQNDHSYSVLSGTRGPNVQTHDSWGKFDKIIATFLTEQKIPGASVAIARDGVILYQQGYGTAGAGRRVSAESLFRIASISKPITACMILKAFDDLKMPLDSKVFGKKGILKKYRTGDKRGKTITVRHLLQHSGGWDREQVDDIIFSRPPCVEKEHPGTAGYNHAILTYALRRKLQFTPGKRHAYSNLGYLILGEVLEEVTGQKFGDYMKDFLRPTGIEDIEVGRASRTCWRSDEVEYYNNRSPDLVKSIFPGFGEVIPQYGGLAMESAASYGGLISNTRNLLQFLHSFHLSTSRQKSNVSACDKRRKDLCLEDKSENSCNETDLTVKKGNGNDAEKSCAFSSCESISRGSESPNCQVSCNSVYSVRSYIGSEKEDQISYMCTERHFPSQQNISTLDLSTDRKHEVTPDISCEVVIDSSPTFDGEISVKLKEDFNQKCLCEHAFFDDQRIFPRGMDNCENNSIKTFSVEDYKPLKDVALLTYERAEESLSRPCFESGHDWYGLGWDVQDDGQSFGHTGGMEGTCSSLYRHRSGISWAFLLNAWATDWDLNGIIKCGLCFVDNVDIFRPSVSTLSLPGGGVQISTSEGSQIILIDVDKCTALNVVESFKQKSFVPVWINMISHNVFDFKSQEFRGKVDSDNLREKETEFEQEVRKRYIIVLDRIVPEENFIVFLDESQSKLEDALNTHCNLNYSISFLDSFRSTANDLRFSAVLRMGKDFQKNTYILSTKAEEYLKQAKQLIKTHDFLSQSVTEVNGELYVSSLLTKKEERKKVKSGCSSGSGKPASHDSKSVFWVQITPENFITELNNQIKKGRSLSYVKFYCAGGKPWVSGCWLPAGPRDRYHRSALSKYGLVPELLEAAENNLTLQCLSEYSEEDGSVYYAAFWYAP
ncbi:uncharacterized protein LOC101853004 [Aplysia californica]|uniref:Uncharacterized protein LOC101853004 n=1 Tax=Aplysia californica TaxID=6500 RepID=A0ABM1VUH5_APLCA|nr:uncharacterized protein LOC101853004 [Aplysia californica]XP_035826067.1 uncharacterized protein LOC101853004 [Aplysia californica]